MIQALLDTGASGYAFIDYDFARKHSFPMSPLPRPRTLEAFDGSTPVFGNITHTVCLNMSIGSHAETNMRLFVTRLSHHPIILGHPWLRKHNPTINWETSIVDFCSRYCRRFCSPWGAVPAPTLSASVSASRVVPPRHRHTPEIVVPVHPDPNLDLTPDLTPGLTSDLTPDLTPDLTSGHGPDVICDTTGLRPGCAPLRLDVARIGAAPFALLARKPGHELFTVSLRDLNQALAPEKAKPDKNVDPATLLPPEYHEFLDVFSRKESNILPPHRPCDHKIELKPGSEPPCKSLYGMSREENIELRKYLEENLEKGFIRASQSPAASPVLFVKKPGGGLRFCVDYRGLNDITIKNRYPLPLISETLSRLSKAVIYSKLDIISAFNRLRIAHGEEWKTAFRTRYGLFEYLVLPFGLCNGPASFQAYINETLREYLDIFCTAYLDDILIYSDSLAQHRHHVKVVLERLRKAGLQIDITKCEFHTTSVAYLGLIITTEGVRMDPVKVETIVNWPVPANVKDVQSFLGFANFYRRFIVGYSSLVKDLTALTGKNVTWAWGPKHQAAFDKLREAFTSEIILAHFDPDRKIVVETDASDYVSAGILSQYDDNGILRPIAFYSKKHAPAECNYEIYDKELMAIVRAFEQWRPELEGSAHTIDVITDHKNLEYFMTDKLLSRRQARWSEFLSRFDFKITYRPGKQGGKPDALTRRSADLPPKGGDGAMDERVKYQNQTVLKAHNLTPEVIPEKFNIEIMNPGSDLNISKPLHLNPINTPDPDGDEDDSPPLEELWNTAREHDQFEVEILNLLQQGIRRSRKIPLAECEDKNGKLYFRDRRYVLDYDPLRLRLIDECHRKIHAGHPGRTKTYALLSRHFWWPRMYDSVKRYVRNCHGCSRNKASRDTYQGWLRPLPPPERRWQDVSMDYVGPFPESTYQGVTFKYILVIRDRLSKMCHLEPTQTMETEEACEVYYNRVWRYHGLFRSCVSDRGAQFVNKLWERMRTRLGIQARLSTAYHPETDGQTEKTNTSIEEYLRHYVNYLQDDWAQWIAGAEFAINNADSVTTGCSPFLANSGQHPLLGFEPAEPLPRNLTTSDRRQILQADAFVERMKDLTEHLHDQILLTQAEQEHHANASRTPSFRYKVGDHVFLNAKNLKRARPNQKLDSKNVGPYPIKKILSPLVYELDLPASMQIHPVFHTNLLQPRADNPLPGQIEEPRPPVVVKDGEYEWFVLAVLDSRLSGRNKLLQYRVRWESEEITWQPWYDLTNCKPALQAFHAQNPRKPGPHPDMGLAVLRP